MQNKADILLRSGFIASASQKYIRGKSSKANANELNYQVIYPGMTHYSSEVVDLSKYYGEGELTPKDMVITDKLMSITKMLFSERSIVDWVNYNISKVSLSVPHRCFLDDFMKLVIEEKQSTVNLSMYVNLLEPMKGNTLAYKNTTYEDIKYSNEEVLHRILSKSNDSSDTYGLIQYILFLNIVFGI